jgi:hypothetical protein
MNLLNIPVINLTKQTGMQSLGKHGHLDNPDAVFTDQVNGIIHSQNVCQERSNNCYEAHQIAYPKICFICLRKSVL